MLWKQQYTKNKYGAKKTVYGGRKFDSKHEAGVAYELDMMIKAGEIVEYQPQVRFDLYGKNGNKITTHIVDFVITYPDGEQKVWEAKSPVTMTDSWKIKRNLFLDNYPDKEYVVIMQNKRIIQTRNKGMK